METLTAYELAWLVGGAERAALVVFVALATDGRLDVAHNRQRVKVARTESKYPVEATALELIPDSGLAVPDLLRQLAATPAVAELAAAVRAKGQLRLVRRLSPAYRDLLKHPGTGIRRVAVLGVPGVDDERLRTMLAHPLPAMPKIDPFTPVRDNTIDGTIDPPANTGYF
ncbi:TIGR04222 domain-containing membrane protein [Kribbella sp.]|uniref:TIGR04222 domain-containing membrane protein n=1 Tax=Kribbella sp. TaxID=1871183 RepID=UPI002D712E96|nr:TIGR04222 domain-containing membrane protein [Kribbella sp.]HZX05361.1 TIGR04222 domain-containing membrane protein [Kribbella sp.]